MSHRIFKPKPALVALRVALNGGRVAKPAATRATIRAYPRIQTGIYSYTWAINTRSALYSHFTAAPLLQMSRTLTSKAGNIDDVQSKGEPAKELRDSEAASWSVEDVVQWAKGKFGDVIADSLSSQEINGTALLDLTEADLKEYGVAKGGPRKNAFKAIAALNATVLACTPAPVAPVNLTGLTKDGKKIRRYTISVPTEAAFDRLLHTSVVQLVDAQTLAVEHGVTTWHQAVQCSRQPGKLLLRSLTWDAFQDDLKSVRGAVANRAASIEFKSAAALLNDPALRNYHPLEPVNDRRGVIFFLNGVKKMEVDGMLLNSVAVFFTECKSALDETHILGEPLLEGGDLLWGGMKDRALKLAQLIADPRTTSNPPDVIDRLRSLFLGKVIIPVAAGDLVSPQAQDACIRERILLQLPEGPGGSYQVMRYRYEPWTAAIPDRLQPCHL